jgi:hypothetical protein
MSTLIHRGISNPGSRFEKNAKAGVARGCVAKRAKENLQWLTGEKVVNGCNFLPPSTRKKLSKE